MQSFKYFFTEESKGAKLNDEHAHAHVWNHMTEKGIAHDKDKMHDELEKSKNDTSHPLHPSNIKSGWVGKSEKNDHSSAHKEMKTAVHTIHNMMKHKEFQDSAKNKEKMKVSGASSGETTHTWKRYGAKKSGATSKADVHLGKHKISMKMSGGSVLASGGPEETNALHHHAANEYLKNHPGTSREKVGVRREIMGHAKKAGEYLNKMKTAKSREEMHDHKKAAQEHLSAIHSKHPELIKHVRREATTGEGKFGKDSHATATHIVKTGENGSVHHVSTVDYSGSNPRVRLPKGKGRTGATAVDERK